MVLRGEYQMTVELKLLGTGAGPGVPSYFCDCAACREARENPGYARTRSGAVINTGRETILIDASPDLRSQLIKEQVSSLDIVFITHWHYDHFGGLGDLEFYVKLGRKKPLKLYLPAEALGDFQAAYPFLEDVFELETWHFGQKYLFKQVQLTPLPANHSVQTAGILLESKRRLGYFTDTAGLPDLTRKRMEKVDYFICDATFYGENWYPHSHMSLWEAIELGKQIEADNVILTHLAMHYSFPVTVVQLKEIIKNEKNVFLAYDGMVFTL